VIMNFDENKRIEPACKVGPGGDFVLFWPTKVSAEIAESSRLHKVAAVLREALAVVLGWGSENPVQDRCEACESGTNAYKPKVAIVRGGRRFLPEPTLFGAECTDIALAVPRPRHRVRIHHKTVKKRGVHKVARQGTLFELERKSAKTA